MKEKLKHWIELLNQSGGNTKKQVRDEMVECLNKLPDIFFVCDGKECENGHCASCSHTSNINHAVNFKRLDGVYVEDDRLNTILYALQDNGILVKR